MTPNGKATKSKKIFEEDREQKRTNEYAESVDEYLETPLRTFPEKINDVESTSSVRVHANLGVVYCRFANGGQNADLFEGADCNASICVQANGPAGEQLSASQSCKNIKLFNDNN
jgi:hypothetical protein